MKLGLAGERRTLPVRVPSGGVDGRIDLVADRSMARKRDPIPTTWGTDRLIQYAADQLIDADDSAIEARATELKCDVRTLRAYVDGSRLRRRAT